LFFFVLVLLFILVAGMDATGAEVGVETVVAFLVIVADIIEWSEFGAVGGLLGGLDGVGRVKELLAINEVRGNSETVKKCDGLSEIEATVDDGIVDAGNGELDGGRILGRGEEERSEPQKRLCADRVDLGVVVAEPAALEGGGLAPESVGLDVATCHEHVVSPLKCRFWSKVLITGELGSDGATVTV
jgi:hypothetical protein